jgi:hypothetical protein
MHGPFGNSRTFYRTGRDFTVTEPESRKREKEFTMSHEGMAGMRATMGDVSALIGSLDDS